MKFFLPENLWRGSLFHMEKADLENMKNKIEELLSAANRDVPVITERVNKILDEEYEKEIKDQNDFLKNTAIIAGIIAPLSLTLLSNLALVVQQYVLLVGFILLLIAILMSLFLSKRSVLDIQYKDTDHLAFNNIMAQCLKGDLENSSKSQQERVASLSEFLSHTSEALNKFSGLARTNKLVILRNVLAKYNEWISWIFLLGIIAVIASILLPFFVLG